MTKKKQDTKGSGAVTGFVLGAATVAATAAGYFLYGPKGAQNRTAVRAWTLKAKGDVLSEFEKMKEVSEDSYFAAVDKVTARYAKLKDVTEAEREKFAAELKKYWKEIKKQASAKQATKKSVAAKKKSAKK